MPFTEYMIPTDQGGLNNAAWVLAGAATKWQAVEPSVPPDVAPTSSSHIRITHPDTASISFGLSAAPAGMATIISVKAGQWGGSSTVSQPIWYAARIGGVLGAWTGIAPWSPVNPIQLAVVDVARPGGGAWIPADIQDVTLEVAIRKPSWAGVDFTTITDVWLEIVYEPVLSGREPAREIGSRRLWALRKPDSVLTVRVPDALGAALELLDYVVVSHFAGPHDSDDGWLTKNWQCRPMRVLEHTAIVGEGAVELRLLDLRHLLCLYQDMAWTTKPTGTTADGIARFGKGLTRTFARNSEAWVDDAAGSGPVVVVTNNREKNADGGLFLEGARTNEIIQSSFKNGAGDVFTGWTKAGTGSNGSNIQQETALLLFDPGESARTVKFTAGDPIHVADLEIVSTITPTLFAANTICRVSIDHYDAATDPLYYAVLRDNDGKWWRDSDQSWQVAKTWNATTASEEAWHRHFSKQMDVGGIATKLTLYIGIPTTAVAAQINYCGHAQIEQGTFVTTRILTEVAIVTRAVDDLLVSNNSIARCWNNAQGAFLCEVIPEWDAADVVAENKTVVFIGHDADNWEWIYYDGANTRWVFERKVATVIYRAIFTASPVRGTAYKLGARWTGTNGELDLAPFTASIFVAGVQGTDVVTVAAPTEATTVDMEPGAKSGADFLDAQIRLIHSYQYVPTDIEMVRLI